MTLNIRDFISVRGHYRLSIGFVQRRAAGERRRDAVPSALPVVKILPLGGVTVGGLVTPTKNRGRRNFFPGTGGSIGVH